MSTEINNIQTTSTNISIGGVGLFIPFIEKLKLYNTFIKKTSFWNKNKIEYWKHEKAILHWAWSPNHQHLARNLDTHRLIRIYGLSKVQSGSEIKYVITDSAEMSEKSKNELILDMQKNSCKKLEPIMGNLLHKGFAYAITYSDLAKQYKEIGDDEYAMEIFKLNNKANGAIYSIMINNSGLLLGELVEEEERGRLWQYKLTMFIAYHIFFLSLITIFVTIFKINIIIPLSSICGLTLVYCKEIILSIILSICWVIWWWIKL